MKKVFFMFASFILLVSIAGCGNDKSKQNDNTGNGVRVENVTSDVTKNECMNGCQIMWKANKGNIEKSSSQMDKDCNSLCNAGQGMQNSDVSSCEKSEGILKDVCYSDVAKKTNVPEICEKVVDTTMMGSCYAMIAKKKKNSALCEKIKETMWKDICIQNAKK
jgi:hypothetical protein